jgi:hypothetical protein
MADVDVLINDGPDDDDDAIHAAIRRVKRREAHIAQSDFLHQTEAGEAQIRFNAAVLPAGNTWVGTMTLWHTPAHDYKVTFQYNTETKLWSVLWDKSIPALQDYRWVQSVWNDFISEHPEIVEFVTSYNNAMRDLPVMLKALQKLQRDLAYLGTADMEGTLVRKNLKAANKMMQIWSSDGTADSN